MFVGLIILVAKIINMSVILPQFGKKGVKMLILLIQLLELNLFSPIVNSS
jgi:hypothetical protein